MTLPRSRGALLAVVEQLDVEHAADLQRRTLPGSSKQATFCNWAIERALTALGVYVPKGLLARQQIQFLAGIGGRADGWLCVLELEAQQSAERGEVVIATWLNPDQTLSSHVALVVPAIGATGTHVMQAGSHNFSNGPIAAGFGIDKLPAVQFFHHA